VRPQFEVSQIIDRFGLQHIEQCQPNSFTLRTLDALQKCRTSALAGTKMFAIVAQNKGSATTVAVTDIVPNASQTNRHFGSTTGSVMPWM